jgi:hypothetical protein
MGGVDKCLLDSAVEYLFPLCPWDRFPRIERGGRVPCRIVWFIRCNARMRRGVCVLLGVFPSSSQNSPCFSNKCKDAHYVSSFESKN